MNSKHVTNLTSESTRLPLPRTTHTRLGRSVYLQEHVLSRAKGATHEYGGSLVATTALFLECGKPRY